MAGEISATFPSDGGVTRNSEPRPPFKLLDILVARPTGVARGFFSWALSDRLIGRPRGLITGDFAVSTDKGRVSRVSQTWGSCFAEGLEGSYTACQRGVKKLIFACQLGIALVTEQPEPEPGPSLRALGSSWCACPLWQRGALHML